MEVSPSLKWTVPSLNKLSDDLAAERHLSRLTLARFSNGRIMGELNAVHPFRDGNGRTQRKFMRQLAARLGAWQE
jgi:cell filamentation protein